MSEDSIDLSLRFNDYLSPLDQDLSGQRMRSMSQYCSADPVSDDADIHLVKKDSEGGFISRNISPIVSNMDGIDVLSDLPSEDSRILRGRVSTGSNVNSTRVSRETRGRLFSELSLSEMPTEYTTGTIVCGN